MDIAEIKDVITASDKLQDDPDGFANLLTEDVSLINIAGRRLSGRETVRETYRKAMATPLANVRTRLEVRDVRSLRPDVAMATCVKHVSDERDQPAAQLPATGMVSFVLVKDQDDWLIAAIQTTPIT